jgi:hypothetical protein
MVTLKHRTTGGWHRLRTMAIDHNVPLTLWKEDEVPACDQSIRLANEFLRSCLRGAHLKGSMALVAHCISMDFHFARYARHRARCLRCEQSEPTQK